MHGGRHVVFGWGFLGGMERGQEGWDGGARGGGHPCRSVSSQTAGVSPSLQGSAPGACLRLLLTTRVSGPSGAATGPSRRPCSILRAVGWESSDLLQFALLEAVREVRPRGSSCACGGRDGILRAGSQGFRSHVVWLAAVVAMVWIRKPKVGTRAWGLGAGTKGKSHHTLRVLSGPRPRPDRDGTSARGGRDRRQG